MMPKISVKFRRRNGIPFAIEQFSGKQFRCRHCNKVFWEEQELDRHLELVNKTRKSIQVDIDTHTPQLNEVTEIRIGYFYDIADALKRKYLRLKKNESYDGVVLSKHNKDQGDRA